MSQFAAAGNKRSFCQQYGLSFERVAEIRDTQQDLLRGLVDLQLLPSVQEALQPGSACNRNAQKGRLVAATVGAGLYPQVAKILRPPKRFVEVVGGAVERDMIAREIKFYIPTSSSTGGTDALALQSDFDVDYATRGLQRVFLHPSSVNFKNSQFREGNFVMYGERQLVTPYVEGKSSAQVAPSKIYLREVTELTPYALLFFAGQVRCDYAQGIVAVDDMVRFSASGRVVAILEAARESISCTLLQKFVDPQLDMSLCPVFDLACDILDLPGQY